MTNPAVGYRMPEVPWNGLTVGSLFSGVGGLDLAVEGFFNARTVWHCEWDKEPSKVLAARWPGVPNLGDVTEVDWDSVEPVDIMCGGFPCQDLSLAGRRAGMRPGTRSGLWSDFVKAIAAVRPKVVVIENVRGLLSGCAESDSDVEPCPGCVAEERGVAHAPRLRALGRVLGDLSRLGFDAEWGALPASSVGAPHGRVRVFVLAYARGVRLGEGWGAVRERVRESAGNGNGFGTPLGDRGPVDRPLLRTPVADELGGGPLHPDVAKERGQTLRLSGQVLALTGNLLPTPVAKPSGNTPEEHLRKKPGRSVVTDLAILVENGLLATGGRMLPTPTASGAEKGGPNQAHGGGDRTLSGTVTLLPTPQVADATGGHATRSGDRGGELLLPGVTVAASKGRLLPTTTAADAKSSGGAEGTSNVTLTDAVVRGRTLMPTPRVASDRTSRSAADVSTSAPSLAQAIELMMGTVPREYQLGAEVDHTGDRQGNVVGEVQWGEYEPAVRLWESLTRPAPAPTLPDGKNGNHRLAAAFPEWMMGYPAGWVTDIIARNPAIKACGNGVVPQQAHAALGLLWSRALLAVAA